MDYDPVKRWNESAVRIMKIWRGEVKGTNDTLLRALQANGFSISEGSFSQYVKPNGRHAPNAPDLIWAISKILAKKLWGRRADLSEEELATEFLHHIEGGKPSPLTIYPREPNSESPWQPEKADNRGSEESRGQSTGPQINEVTHKPEDGRDRSLSKIRPRIHIATRAQDDDSVVLLSLDTAGQTNFNAETAELSQILLAEIFLSPVSDDDGMICFKAVTIRVPPNSIPYAGDAGVSITFDEFRASRPGRDIFGSYDELRNVKVGKTDGIQTAPIWKINELPDIADEGLRIYDIELGNLRIRCFSEVVLGTLELEFQAVVNVKDLVWVPVSGNEARTEDDKIAAFDRVLANKKLKGNGRLAALSSSVVVIDFNNGLGQ